MLQLSNLNLRLAPQDVQDIMDGLELLGERLLQENNEDGFLAIKDLVAKIEKQLAPQGVGFTRNTK